MSNPTSMANDPDPQADATREAFAQATGTPPPTSNVDIAPTAAPVASVAPDPALRQALPSHSFAHEAMPDERNGVLTHDFNEAARDAGQPAEDETQIEQPGTPALELTPPPEYRLSPELEAMSRRENAKLAIHRGDEVGLKKDRGLDLGL